MVAGFAKLVNPGATGEAMASSGWLTALLGDRLEHAAAGLGFAEVALGAWLVSGVRPGASAMAALVLLAVFSVYLAAERLLGTTPGGCGCGLGSDRLATWMGLDTFVVALWRNVLLGGVALVVLARKRARNESVAG